jgi:hypothetical protein
LLKRWAPAVWPVVIAAVIVPRPCSLSSCGWCASVGVVLGLELALLAGELADLLEHRFGDLRASAPSLPSGLGGGPGACSGTVERCRAQLRLEPRVDRERVPAQPVGGRTRSVIG